MVVNLFYCKVIIISFARGIHNACTYSGEYYYDKELFDAIWPLILLLIQFTLKDMVCIMHFRGHTTQLWQLAVSHAATLVYRGSEICCASCCNF